MRKNKMKNQSPIKKIVLTALFAALTCIATMIIRIPTPTNGYLNLGDVFVLTSGLLLGPLYGTLAAGIGSCLADLFAGYLIYVPGTLIIKALTAFVASLIHKLITGKKEKYNLFSLISACVTGELFMVIGYLLYEAALPGINLAAALLSVPGNLMQGLAGVVICIPLIKLLKTAKITEKI